MLPFLLATFAILPQPIDLDGISLERARAMNGKLVRASFLNVAPAYTMLGRTVIGPANREDGAERTAVLRGNRLDVDEGERVNIVGTLKVIDHKPAVVNGVAVTAWVEVRVAEE
jgi:hypothetical protein